MKKHDSEYESIRNEIVSLNEMRDNLWINMFIIYITLFSFGLQFSYNLFLVTYIVLIPFQMKINQYKRMSMEAGIYIKTIYENNSQVGWEVFHFRDEYIKIHNKGKWYFMVGTGSTQLGLLSTIFYIFFVVRNNEFYQILYRDALLVLLSLCLLIILIIVNWNTTKVIDVNAYKNIVEKYKMEVNESKK